MRGEVAAAETMVKAFNERCAPNGEVRFKADPNRVVRILRPAFVTMGVTRSDIEVYGAVFVTDSADPVPLSQVEPRPAVSFFTASDFENLRRIAEDEKSGLSLSGQLQVVVCCVLELFRRLEQSTSDV